MEKTNQPDRWKREIGEGEEASWVGTLTTHGPNKKKGGMAVDLEILVKGMARVKRKIKMPPFEKGKGRWTASGISFNAGGFESFLQTLG